MKRWFWSMAVAAALLVPLAGCAGSVRVYDPYGRDYHRWDRREDYEYRHYEHERHEAHRDYRRRNAEEQREYWEWRHRHGDRDHDYDRDRDRR